MGIKSDRPIYGLIEKHLKANSQPVTCNVLMDIDEIRLEALNEFGGTNQDIQLATNKMSDLLEFMWRRGVLTRFPAPKNGTSFARYSYTWNEKPEPDVRPIPSPPLPSVGKTRLEIKETDSGVEIELGEFGEVIR